MASLFHETIVELLAEHPEVLLPALREPLGEPCVDLELHPNAPSTRNASAPHLELALRRRGEVPPFASVAVEVQLTKDDAAPYSWLRDHAERHACLRVPSYLVVITHDPAVAAWAAGPFTFGMLTMRPAVLMPIDLLEARGVPLDPPLRQRITSCTDLDRLAQWLRRAATTTIAEEVFAP